MENKKKPRKDDLINSLIEKDKKQKREKHIITVIKTMDEMNSTKAEIIRLTGVFDYCQNVMDVQGRVEAQNKIERLNTKGAFLVGRQMTALHIHVHQNHIDFKLN